MSSLKRASNDTIAEIQNGPHSDSATNDPLEITDLNDDCLERIFEYFDLSSFKFNLLNIADTCIRFREVARTTYKYKHSRKSLEISLFPRSNNLRILRIFGDLIEKLSIDYNNDGIYTTEGEISSKFNIKIEQYIFRYCSQDELLKELELINCPDDAFECIKNPFKNVEVVRFSRGVLCEKISQFNRYFPKMRSLKLDNIFKAVNPNCMKTKFPFLEHLELDCPSTELSIQAAIPFNPQLRSTWLRCK